MTNQTQFKYKLRSQLTKVKDARATYSHNPFNRLSSTSSASYGYDKNGAMTSRTDSSGTMNFSYDSDGRLVFAYNDSWQFAEFRYDALGRRIYKSEPNDLPRSFTYDGEDMLVQNWAGFDSTYLNGPGIDNKLSAKLAGGTSPIYYHLDHLGTPTGNSNAAGSLTAYATPDSYGNGSFEFTGREYDDFTELYYYRARMYDPKLGRFISEDPIGFAGGDVNVYGFVWNNPSNWSDPMGLDPFKLPANPGQLPPGWTPDNTHKNPNGSRWTSPSGDSKIEFEPGRQGETGWKGKIIGTSGFQIPNGLENG